MEPKKSSLLDFNIYRDSVALSRTPTAAFPKSENDRKSVIAKTNAPRRLLFLFSPDFLRGSRSRVFEIFEATPRVLPFDTLSISLIMQRSDMCQAARMHIEMRFSFFRSCGVSAYQMECILISHINGAIRRQTKYE